MERVRQSIKRTKGERKENNEIKRPRTNSTAKVTSVRKLIVKVHILDIKINVNSEVKNNNKITQRHFLGCLTLKI